MKRAYGVALACVLLTALQALAGDGAAPASSVIGGEFTYIVRRGDFLGSIGSRFGVSENVLAKDNGLKPPYRLKIGDRLRIENRHLIPETREQGILINIPQRMLFLFRDGKFAASYPVGLGKIGWETPTGSFHVTQLEKNKTWCVPKSIQEEMRRAGKPVLTRVPPGPDNPLGEYWIGLSLAGYGIHGTTAPASIYRFQTHGCIRLHPDDAAKLYAQAFLKLPVTIIYVPALLSRLEDGRILVEVNPDVYNRGGDPLRVLRDTARGLGVENRIDWTLVGKLVRAKEGLAREVGKAELSEEEIDGRKLRARSTPVQTAPH